MNAAERIYIASASGGETAARLAEELARRIEDDIASRDLTPGGALGSLRELSERYCVGRSVAREALGLLERRGLGRLRPGPCGGFILARPQPQIIGEQLAEYFRATGVSRRHLMDAREAVDLMAARRAGEPVLLMFVACLDSLSVDLGCADREPRQRKTGAPVHAAVATSRSPATGGGTLATTIARTLAAEIAGNSSTGTRLGSEWDLCERFNVSRLTLRQAVRLLQDSGLVECRRGRGNGLVVRDLRASGAIRLMLAYLIGEKLNPMAAGTILFELNCFVPALAVVRANANERQELGAALARVESCDPFDRYDLLGLVQCVSRVAGSPIIDLFSRCLAAYEARFRPSLAERLPASAQGSYFRLMRRLLDRVPVGDTAELEWAKAEASALMLEMSRRRPI